MVLAHPCVARGGLSRGRRRHRPESTRTSETKSVDTRGCSRGRHVGEPGGKEPCRRCRRRNGLRWLAASWHRGFRRFCRASGGVSGRAWPCRAPRRSRHARRGAGWPTPPRGGPGRRRAGRDGPRRSAATWAGPVPLSGRPSDRVLRLVSLPVRPALRLALRAARDWRKLPEIPRVLGGSIPPGSISSEKTRFSGARRAPFLPEKRGFFV